MVQLSDSELGGWGVTPVNPWAPPAVPPAALAPVASQPNAGYEYSPGSQLTKATFAEQNAIASQRKWAADLALANAESAIAGLSTKDGEYGHYEMISADPGTTETSVSAGTFGTAASKPIRTFVSDEASAAVKAYRQAKTEADLASKYVTQFKDYANDTGSMVSGTATGGGSGSGGGSGGSGSGGSGLASQDPRVVQAYIDSLLSDEVDARYKDAKDRATTTYNLQDAERSYATDAYSFNAAMDKAVRSGAIDWGQGAWAGPVRPGGDFFSELFRKTVPQSIPPDYQEAAPWGLLGGGFQNDNFDQWGAPKYGKGTLSLYDEGVKRFAGGTTGAAGWFAQQQLANNLAHSPLPAGFHYTTTPTQQYSPTATPGTIWENSQLPTSQQNYGGQAWDQNTLNTMLSRISSGVNAGTPAGFPDVSDYVGHGIPIPAPKVAEIATWIRAHGSDPALQQAFGTRPADDPNAFVTDPSVVTSGTQQALAQSADDRAWLNIVNNLMQQNGGSSSGVGTAAGRAAGGSYAGPTSASLYNSASGSGTVPLGDPDLDKKLAWEREKFAAQQEVTKWDQAFQNKQFDSSQAYQQAQLALQQAQARLNEANSNLDNLRFEEQKRGTGVDERLRQQQLDEMKRAGMTDEQIRQQQLEEQRRSSLTDEQQRADQFIEQKRAQAVQEGLSAAEFEHRLAQDAVANGFTQQQIDESISRDKAQQDQWMQGFIEQKRAQAVSEGLNEAQFQHQVSQDAARLGLDQQSFAEAMRKNQSEEAFRTSEAARNQGNIERQFAQDAADKKAALNVQRAQITADLGAHGTGNAIQGDLFIRAAAGDQEPVGTAYDIFTGKPTGQKTLSQVNQEDVPYYDAARTAAVAPDPVVVQAGAQAMATGGYTTDPVIVTGDDPKSNKATGYDEILLNLTRAPIAVMNNRDAQRTAYVPPKGRQYPSSVKDGRMGDMWEKYQAKRQRAG